MNTVPSGEKPKKFLISLRVDEDVRDIVAFQAYKGRTNSAEYVRQVLLKHLAELEVV
jgi:hypothetical protein